MIPLGAARERSTGRYTCEDYELSFAPSLSALRVTRDQAHKSGAKGAGRRSRLLSVAYPGIPHTEDYLSGVMGEAEIIGRYFDEVTPLHDDAATPAAVIELARGQDVVYFGCHGLFDPDAPSESGLMLSGGWLTVQRIVAEFRLDQAYLVTAAACQSGQMEVRQGEEHVGLLQALMTAGVRSVAAGLWKVDDVATRALFGAFYTGVAASCPPARALADAARCVRERPGWEHPYYWAAFQMSGLPQDLGEASRVVES
ncbi:MAG: CHAT domain-containing protein [Chloroflexota bacterium]|nr:CHAT domain-containing protein [Chloroflexota bacterium]